MARKTIVLLLMFFFSIYEITAQTGFDDDVDDVGTPAAPINNHLVIATCVAVCLGYIRIKQISKLKKTSKNV